MFLTRFRMNAQRRGTRKLVGSRHALHAAVLAGFADPNDHTRPGARTLWRLDRGAGQQLTLYIVSPGRPDLTHLIEQAGWPTIETWQTRPYDAFLDTLEKGQIWAFRLTANPSRNGRKTPDATRSQRFGAVTVEQQAAWLTQRSARHGFTICDQHDGIANLLVHQREMHTFARDRGQPPVTIATATYDGVLRVEEAEALRHTLTSGIGHAKGYGCGLMTLAAASTEP